MNLDWEWREGYKYYLVKDEYDRPVFGTFDEIIATATQKEYDKRKQELEENETN